MNYSLEDLRTALRQIDEKIEQLKAARNYDKETWQYLRNRQGKLINLIADY